ncbi:MAG: pyruvate, phosphate dikinase [Bacilli bacterium]|nr:pyruvate, phosphate dikinase [Bacilli bacterium]
MEKYVYLFDEGNKDMRDLLGGKGANLAEMTSMHLPVPYGLTITTEACKKYYDDNETIDKIVEKQILEGITKIENKTGKTLGDINDPLLVSVRSGSPISMPGMMDTILNLGLTDEIAASLAKDEESARFIYDSYRRLIMMFADVVRGKGKEEFEKILTNFKEKKETKNDLDLDANDMFEITKQSKKVYYKLTGEKFPEEPIVQLLESVKAVFRSWNNERAKIYRKMNNISDDLGTAVNIQEMVYGNLSETSLTGVAFSRNPSTGEDKLYGEFLEKAQGEDIVAGVRTPKNIDDMDKDIHDELNHYAKVLEKHYKDMQDMEFTVENGKLYMLQTRIAKRTSLAALNAAVDMKEEGLITKKEALFRVKPDDLNNLMHETFTEESLKESAPIAKGLPASPGAAIGKIYLTVEDAVKEAKKGNKTILVRTETSPEDIEAMNYSEGILTVHGGMTSHAAVVARGIGKCCVSGCQDIIIDEKNKIVKIGSKIYEEGSYISLNGTTGEVYEGILETEEPKITGNFEKLLSWAKEYNKLKVRANADTAKDAKVAINFGADGIGLCRTEHMFFEKDKIFSIRKLIVSDKEEDRKKALKELLPMQQKDFEELFKETKEKVLTIRLLDPPLHEFLPKTDEEIYELAKALKIEIKELKNKVNSLKEFNPMMGLRGCRLGIIYPEITSMQAEAIFRALINVNKKGCIVNPEIMIPLVGDVKELKYLKDIITNIGDIILKGTDIKYKIGTMIEVPRSAVLADTISKEADFFSFGTNDLTQMTYGFSRDDAGSFINTYYEKQILPFDPFKTIDKEGVGKLMIVAIKLAKNTNKKIELGVCGEHGGDEESIKFFHKIGLDYVSCSPYRVPIAILASAQCELENN